jgi:GT2 family glycosyltransferase
MKGHEMTTIDIAVPCYNYGRFLADCLNSIRGQDVDGLRILVIDNASSDDSAAIAQEAAFEDTRIQLRRRPANLGPHASFNEGIDWAQADCFAILCADDMFAPGALRRAMKAMDEAPEVDLVYGTTSFVAGDQRQSGAEPPSGGATEIVAGVSFIEAFCRTGRSLIDGPTAVVRTSAQKRAGHYRPALVHTDDVEMWMRIAAKGSVARLDAVQVLARIHAANQSAAVSNVHLWNVEMERAFESFFADAGASLAEAPRLRGLARRSLAERAYLCAVSHVLRGEAGSGELLRFALSRRPSLALLPPMGALLGRGDGLARAGAAMAALSGRLMNRSASARQEPGGRTPA